MVLINPNRMEERESNFGWGERVGAAVHGLSDGISGGSSTQRFGTGFEDGCHRLHKLRAGRCNAKK